MHELIHVATVSSSHGVRGEFKLFCLLEDQESLANYQEFYDESGTRLPLTLLSLKGKQPIARMPHITDKNAADALKQTKLYVRASEFPPTDEDVYYSVQLVGLKVLDEKRAPIGTIHAHHNFGAGDVLEIQFTDGTTELYPFKHAFFPEVDIPNGTISFVPPTYV